MRKRHSRNHQSSSSSLIRSHLEKADRVRQHESQLRINKDKIASIYILGFSLVLTPALIYAIMRFYLNMEPVVTVSQEEVREYLETEYFGYEQHDVVAQEIEAQYQETIAALRESLVITGPVFTKLLNLGMGDFLDKLKENELSSENFLENIGKIITTIQEHYSLTLEYAKDIGFSGQLAKNNPLLKKHPEIAKLIEEGVARCYALVQSQVEAFHSLIPKKVIIFHDVSVEPWIDLDSRQLDFSKKIPPLSSVVNYMRALRTAVSSMIEKGKTTVLEQSIEDTHRINTKITEDKQKHDAEVLQINYYSMLLTTGLSGLTYRLLTPLINAYWPLKYWTSNKLLSASRMDVLSTADLNRLDVSLETAIVDTQIAAQRNHLLVKITYFMIGLFAMAAFLDNQVLLAFGFIIFHAIGLLLVSSFERGLAAVRNYQFDANFNKIVNDLETLFPLLQIKPLKQTTLAESSVQLAVTNSIDQFTKAEYINLILSALSKFNVAVLVASTSEHKILIAANQKIPVEKIRIFLEMLQTKVIEVKEIEAATQAALKKYKLEKRCRGKIIYDDEGSPSFQLVVNSRAEGVREFLTEQGFATVKQYHFVLEIQQALKDSFFAAFKEVVKCSQDPSIPQTTINTETRGTTSLLSESTHDHDEATSSVTPAVSSDLTYVWHNVCDGENVTSNDPRVRSIENGDFPIYLLFRLNPENMEPKLYNQFWEKAAFLVRSSMGYQGIKLYSTKGREQLHFPDGAIGRVKILGNNADATLFVYAHQERDQPSLWYTGDEETYNCHKR